MILMKMCRNFTLRQDTALQMAGQVATHRNELVVVRDGRTETEEPCSYLADYLWMSSPVYVAKDERNVKKKV